MPQLLTTEDDTGLIDEMDSLAQHIMSESPKIEEAVKNHLSILLARSIAVTNAGGIYEIISAPVALACARVLLKAINLTRLHPPLEWGVINPQKEEQTSVERIDELMKYKVMFLLHEKAFAKGGKTTKLFGKSFFFLCKTWQEIRSQIEDENMQKENKIDEDSLSYFLSSLGAACGGPIGDWGVEDAELVWSSNFKELLNARQEKRKVGAQKRIEEVTTDVTEPLDKAYKSTAADTPELNPNKPIQAATVDSLETSDPDLAGISELKSTCDQNAFNGDP